MTYALDVLEARGDLEPGSPEAEKFVEDYLKDVTMHEVGHTLGLRHNFRASRIYTRRSSSPTRRSRANNGIDRLGDGVRADQPRAPGARERRHAVQRHARPLRLLGDRVRLQADRPARSDEAPS